MINECEGRRELIQRDREVIDGEQIMVVFCKSGEFEGQEVLRTKVEIRA